MAAVQLDTVEAGAVVTMAPNACAGHEQAGTMEAPSHGRRADPPGGRTCDGGADVCANCLHPADMHTGDGEAGRTCDVEIAVSWSDGPDQCPCERCIPHGTRCSVDGCGEAAVRFRVDASGQVARDMCAAHYDEAEPRCERYCELTGSAPIPPGTLCGVDGCGEAAAGYVLGRDHAVHYMCVEHAANGVPYRRRYYEMTGGRPFPEGTPCCVDGCDGEAVHCVSAYKAGACITGPEAGAVCGAHYSESAPALLGIEGGEAA